MSRQLTSGPSSCFWGSSITLRHAIFGRTQPDERSARRRDLYLTQNTQKRHTHPCLRPESNPQSQQANGRKTTPYTAQPTGPANLETTEENYILRNFIHVLSTFLLMLSVWVQQTQEKGEKSSSLWGRMCRTEQGLGWTVIATLVTQSRS